MKETRIIFILLLVMATVVSNNAQSQCIANAGIDTTLCAEQGFDSYFLGGSPTALEGTPPFSYAWTCTVDLGTIIFTEVDFLDDPALQILNSSGFGMIVCYSI